jgi:hypothetical protein
VQPDLGPIRFLFLLVGIPLGLGHWMMAAQAVFVFRENEPLSSWVAVLAGFGLTLPLILLAAWRARWAGYGLVAVGVTSIAAAVWGTPRGELRELLTGVTTVNGPALLLGGALLLVTRRPHRT